ncbi:hypothetical protein BDN72DRAFT_901320 [Pluteus cervinus]|uniref:Uncharacterized protein n=1 Tax=Pluteus cervinus TaxID=181527 RepID=A0ACD3AFS9_9AGAR|nr:hypothetical protein BDN72DRAFT_901320 [Pluteus cervinus]
MDDQTKLPLLPAEVQDHQLLRSNPAPDSERSRLEILVEKLVCSLAEVDKKEKDSHTDANIELLGGVIEELHHIIKAYNGGNDNIDGTVTPVPDTPYSVHIHHFTNDPLSFSILLAPNQTRINQTDVAQNVSSLDPPCPPNNTLIAEDTRDAIFKNMSENGRNVASYVDNIWHGLNGIELVPWEPQNLSSDIPGPYSISPTMHTIQEENRISQPLSEEVV